MEAPRSATPDLKVFMSHVCSQGGIIVSIESQGVVLGHPSHHRHRGRAPMQGIEEQSSRQQVSRVYSNWLYLVLAGQTLLVSCKAERLHQQGTSWHGQYLDQPGAQKVTLLSSRQKHVMSRCFLIEDSGQEVVAPVPYWEMCSAWVLLSFSMASMMCFMPPGFRMDSVEKLVCAPVPVQGRRPQQLLCLPSQLWPEWLWCDLHLCYLLGSTPTTRGRWPPAHAAS